MIFKLTPPQNQGDPWTETVLHSFGGPDGFRSLARLVRRGDAIYGTTSAGGLLDRVRLLCTVYDPLSGKYRLDYALFIEMLAGLIALGGTAVFLVRERRRASRESARARGPC